MEKNEIHQKSYTPAHETARSLSLSRTYFPELFHIYQSSFMQYLRQYHLPCIFASLFSRISYENCKIQNKRQLEQIKKKKMQQTI